MSCIGAPSRKAGYSAAALANEEAALTAPGLLESLRVLGLQRRVKSGALEAVWTALLRLVYAEMLFEELA
jgi:hypothetical protein